jgi:hypothetical protein
MRNLTHEQKTIMAIIQCFENGRPNLFHQTFWNPKTKELSGGLLMASTLSGNLGKLLRLYQAKGGKLIPDLWIRLVESKTILNDEKQIVDFRALFKQAAGESAMKDAQQEFFTDRFLLPAETQSAKLGVTEPLGRVVILDSIVQGAFKTVLQHIEEHYSGTQIDLNQWDLIRDYMRARREWLASHSDKTLNKTVDRLDSLIPLEKAGNWKLDLPILLVTKGITLTESDLN